jgi:hypothetical protein
MPVNDIFGQMQGVGSPPQQSGFGGSLGGQMGPQQPGAAGGGKPGGPGGQMGPQQPGGKPGGPGGSQNQMGPQQPGGKPGGPGGQMGSQFRQAPQPGFPPPTGKPGMPPVNPQGLAGQRPQIGNGLLNLPQQQGVLGQAGVDLNAPQGAASSMGIAQQMYGRPY